jgi:predicted  nucleic acid-binding Zn-ribbon protein
MKDAIQGIEFLGIPAWIAIAVVGVLLIIEIIGCILDFKGKVVPEIINIRGHLRRKREEREEAARKAKETADTLAEVKQLLSDVNSHYNKDNITKRNSWMNDVDKSVRDNDALIQALGGKIDRLLETNEDLKDQLNQVKSNVLENEADRLRSELFDCGNRCRRNIRLHPEEMEHIRAVWNKYYNILHQNGSGEKEFNFITDYYNRQSFPTYHQPND